VPKLVPEEIARKSNKKLDQAAAWPPWQTAVRGPFRHAGAELDLIAPDAIVAAFPWSRQSAFMREGD
jgi:hypothetical protein